jgi:hypothetical protein
MLSGSMKNPTTSFNEAAAKLPIPVAFVYLPNTWFLNPADEVLWLGLDRVEVEEVCLESLVYCLDIGSGVVKVVSL